MAFEGMDVGRVQGLARQVEQLEQALSQVAALTAALAGQLAYHWQGPASAMFQHDWDSRYRPGLGAAARALSDLHGHLITNIQQQQSASAAAGGDDGSPLGALAGVAAGAWNVVQEVTGYEGLLQTPIDQVVNVAGKGENLFTRPYGKAWSQVMKLDKDGKFLQYKESPVLNALHDSPRVQRVADFLGETHPAAVLSVADKASTRLGYVATAVDTGKAVDDVARHQYGKAVGSAVDATSDALMNTGNPVTFLAGADIKLVKTDVVLAQQVDWKEGLPNPFSGSNWSTDYVPAFKQLPGQFVSTLAGVF